MTPKRQRVFKKSYAQDITEGDLKSAKNLVAHIPKSTVDAYQLETRIREHLLRAAM